MDDLGREGKGLSHHGDPDEEVIVIEEPERDIRDDPKVVRAPRAPTQAGIDAHAATHLPHAELRLLHEGQGSKLPSQE